jgi:hypothetical protein
MTPPALLYAKLHTISIAVRTVTFHSAKLEMVCDISVRPPARQRKYTANTFRPVALMLHFVLVCARIKLNVYTPGKYARILYMHAENFTRAIQFAFAYYRASWERERTAAHRLDAMKAF